jgi:hypothetical protein
MALAPRTVQNMPDRLSLPTTVLHPLRFRKRKGCKTVLGRLKRSGMFWTVRGANTIISLRCCELSGRFEDYWESRRAQA